MDKHFTDINKHELFIPSLREQIAYDTTVDNTSVGMHTETANEVVGLGEAYVGGISGKAPVTLDKIDWSELESVYGQFVISSLVDPTDIGAVINSLNKHNAVTLDPWEIEYIQPGENADPKIHQYAFTGRARFTGTLSAHVFMERVLGMELIGTGYLSVLNATVYPTVKIDGVVQKVPGTFNVVNQRVEIINPHVKDNTIDIPRFNGTIHRLIKLDIGNHSANRPFGNIVESIDPGFLYMDDDAKLSGLFAGCTINGVLPRLLSTKCNPSRVTLEAILYNTTIDPDNIDPDWLTGFKSIVSIKSFFYSVKFTKPWDVSLEWFEPYKDKIEDITELFAAITTTNVLNSFPEKLFAGWVSLKNCTRAMYWLKVTQPFSGLVFDGVYINPIIAESMFRSTTMFATEGKLMTPETVISFTSTGSMYSGTNLTDASDILRSIIRTSKDTVTTITGMFSSSTVETFGDVELDFPNVALVDQLFNACKNLKVLPTWKTNVDGTIAGPIYTSAIEYAANCELVSSLTPQQIPRAKNLTRAFVGIGKKVTGSTRIPLGYIPSTTVIAREMYYTAKVSDDDTADYVDWDDLNHKYLTDANGLLMQCEVKSLKHFRLNLQENPNTVDLGRMFNGIVTIAVYPDTNFFASMNSPVKLDSTFAAFGSSTSEERLRERRHITYTFHLPPADKIGLITSANSIYSGCQVPTKLQDTFFTNKTFATMMVGFSGLLNVESNDDFKHYIETAQLPPVTSIGGAYGAGGYGSYRWTHSAEQKLTPVYNLVHLTGLYQSYPPTIREIMGEFTSSMTPASTTFNRVGLWAELSPFVTGNTLDNTTGEYNRLIPLLENKVYTITTFTTNTCDFLPTENELIRVLHDTPLMDSTFLRWREASDKHFYIRG